MTSICGIRTSGRFLKAPLNHVQSHQWCGKSRGPTLIDFVSNPEQSHDLSQDQVQQPRHQMKQNVGQMWLDAVHTFHDSIEMWFNDVEVLVQNPHDAWTDPPPRDSRIMAGKGICMYVCSLFIYVVGCSNIRSINSRLIHIIQYT